MVSIVQSVLFLAFFIVIATSFIMSSLFRFKSIIPYLLSIYLLTFANILLTGELAGLFNLLNNRFFFLLVHFIFLTISYFIWKKMKSPPAFEPLIRLFKSINFIDIWIQIKKHTVLVGLGLCVAAIYILGFILVLKIPPNNYDSMTCHMARIGYWLQHGNFLPWQTWFTLQVDYPINAQIPVLWSIVFWRTDSFAGATLWFAAIFSILAIYGIARLMGRTRSQSIFASLIFALFPEILLQSTTTMPHLLASAFAIISFYFLFLAFHERSKELFVFSGMAIAIALGVHLIIWIMLPGYAITVFYLAIKNRRDQLKPIQRLLISGLVSFLLLSSYIFIQNSILWHQPFGRSTNNNPWNPGNNVISTQDNSYWQPKNVMKYTFFNMSRYIFATYDLTGIPDSISDPLYDLRDSIAVPLFDLTHNPRQAGEFNIFTRPKAVSENWAWFGLVGFLLFFPLMIIEFIGAIKKRDPIRLSLIMNIVLYALIWSAVLSREKSWTIYSGRYFVVSGMLFAPLIAILYRKSLVSKLLCSFLLLVSMFIGYQTMLNNYAKPLTNNGAIFNWPRLGKIFNVSWDQFPLGEAVEKYVPKNGTLGLALTPSLMEYPYFGEYFKRTLVPIFPYEEMQNKQWLKDNNVNWIISCVEFAGKPQGFSVFETIPFNYPIGISKECSLYKRN